MRIQRSGILNVILGGLIGHTPGEEYEAAAQIGVVFADCPVDLHAIDVEHLQIAEDNVDGFSGLELSERFASAGCTEDFVAAHTAQIARDGLQEQRLVVYQQNSHFKPTVVNPSRIGISERHLWSISRPGIQKATLPG